MRKYTIWLAGLSLVSQVTAAIPSWGDTTAPQCASGSSCLHPDLQVGALYTPEDMNRILAELQRIRGLVSEQVTTDPIFVPDYKIAHEALKQALGYSLNTYLGELVGIYNDVAGVLSKLKALKEQADQELSSGNTDGPFSRALQLEGVRLLPALATRTNQQYQKALKNLFTLNGTFYLDVDRSFFSPIEFKIQLKDQWIHSNELDYSLLGLCRTQVCSDTLRKNLLETWNFLLQFNKSVDLFAYRNTDWQWTPPSGVSPSPFVTDALIDVVKGMVGVGLTPNKTYTVPGMVAQVTFDAMKSASALPVSLLVVPSYLFEKTAKFLATLRLDRFMKVELNLDAVAAYSFKKVEKNFIPLELKRSSRLPPVAYTPEEGKRYEALAQQQAQAIVCKAAQTTE